MKIFTKEHRNKLRQKKIGRVGNNKGKHWKVKDSSKMKRFGKENPSWKGGICQNKDYISWLKNKRNRMPKIGSHTFEEWETLKAQYNWTCLNCQRKEPEIKLTEDHIIPLSKGGSDNIENIQPLCSHCNSKKHATIMNYKKS